jgi:hypothetical protein
MFHRAPAFVSLPIVYEAFNKTKHNKMQLDLSQPPKGMELLKLWYTGFKYMWVQNTRKEEKRKKDSDLK